MRETKNLLLKLPDPTDYVQVEDLNENFTKIDTELKGFSDALDNTFSGSYNDLTDKPKIVAFVSSEITPDTDMSTLSDGVYYTHPLPNESSLLYLAWRDHIAGFMDITSPGLYMRLMITTIRYYGRNHQIVNVLSGATNYLNKPLFTCTRASVTDNSWCDWSFSYPTLYGEGNPQGSVLGVNKMKYMDTLTGDLYVKSSSTKLTPTNAGWTKIASNSVISGVSLAQYTCYGSMISSQMITADTPSVLTYGDTTVIGSDTNSSLRSDDTIVINVDGVYEVDVLVSTVSKNDVTLTVRTQKNGLPVFLPHRGVDGISYTEKLSLRAGDSITVSITANTDVTVYNQVTVQRVG